MQVDRKVVLANSKPKNIRVIKVRAPKQTRCKTYQSEAFHDQKVSLPLSWKVRKNLNKLFRKLDFMMQVQFTSNS